MKDSTIYSIKERRTTFWFTAIILLWCCWQSSQSQSIQVRGTLSAATTPVKNALVIFIDNSDTTKKFYAQTDAAGFYQVDILASVEASEYRQPTVFSVSQNYPNPFSGTTIIPFVLQQESNVSVVIYDLLGREVRSFEFQRKPYGIHYVLWDGKNNTGTTVATGIYFCRVSAGGVSQVRKLLFGVGNHTHPGVQMTSSVLYSIEQKPIVTSYKTTSFTVRIENTESTIPHIVPKEVQNILIGRDTTIHFTVGYYPTFAIDVDSLRQVIRGFGAANIVGWRPDMTSDEIEKAFGTGDGQIGFSILRLRISPNSTDWGNNVPTAKAAYQRGATLIASPWSPPANMKTNNNLVGGMLREDAYENYAAHLRAFVEYMTAQGAPISAVSLQNEPDIKVTYESCDWYANQMIKFLKEYGTSLGTKVMAPESYQFRRQLSDSILNDGSACQNLDIVCGHIYGGGLFAYPLAEEKGKEVWMTEHLTGSDNTTNPQSWSLAFPVAKEINDVMKARMSAYVWWYIVRYYGPISDGTNNSGAKGDVTKKGYVMSQFARFIRPGFRMVDCSVVPSLSGSIDGTAYREPGTKRIVIVALNAYTSARECIFKCGNHEVTTGIPYVTTETKNCQRGNEFEIQQGMFSYTLEPMSVTTFILQ